MSTKTNFKKAILMAALICCPIAYADTDMPTKDMAPSIQSQIAADKVTSDSKINVTTTPDGVVKLSGNVNTDAEADRAIEIAESTQGVKDVDTSNLTVKDSKHMMSDATITAKVKGKYIREKIFGDKDISVMGVTVETTDGVVTLTGTVDKKEEMDNAIKIAKSVTGVKEVKSKLEVKAPATT